MIQVIEKNEGQKIAYEESGTRIYFGDDELMINAAKYQRDWPVQVDICSNRDQQLVIGASAGLYYVAQLDIPATKYTEPENPGSGPGDDPVDPPTPIPIDMSEVVLTLWSIESPTPVEE